MDTKENSKQQSQSVRSNLRKMLFSVCNCTGTRKKPNKSCCIEVDPEKIRHPDLAIYSQLEEIQEGNQPNWDSPDITTNHWKPFRLMETATVRVRNLSADTPASNALVHYSISPFGIGTPKELKLTKKVNVPASAEIELQFPLDSETLNGDQRVGVHIDIEHPHDEYLINNMGSQVHDGSYTSEVGRTHSIQIPVVNNSGLSRTIQLSVLPTDIIATISPSSHHLAPHEQIIATLSMEVPGFLSGAADSVINRSVTVIGRVGGELIGGVTKLLRIDN